MPIPSFRSAEPNEGYLIAAARSRSTEIDVFVEIALHRAMSVDVYLRQLKACRVPDVSDRLGAIAAPTLVIHGDVDPLVPLENGRLLAQGVSGARLVVYEDTGHIPQVEVERAEAFNRDLVEFVAA